MILTRHCYGDDVTLGRLEFDGRVLRTIERPWRPGLPGGLPGVSCVADGRYDLIGHVRPNGDRVCALRNPALGVYYSERSVPPEGGRSLILIHAANWAHELQGCIAPGMTASIENSLPMVHGSRRAMAMVMAWFERQDGPWLEIRCTEGARNMVTALEPF